MSRSVFGMEYACMSIRLVMNGTRGGGGEKV